MKHMILGAALVLSVVPVAAIAANGPSYDVATFDIAGIQLGMDNQRAADIMRANGFSVREAKTPFNFARFVRDEARKLKQSVPSVTSHEGPASLYGRDSQGNSLSVSFLDIGEGFVVSDIKLSFDKETNTQETIPSDIKSRYGAPSSLTRDRMNHIWCTAGDPGCANKYGSHSPVFFHNWFNGHSITLTNVRAMTELRDQKVAALFSKPTADRQRSLLSPR